MTEKLFAFWRTATQNKDDKYHPVMATTESKEILYGQHQRRSRQKEFMDKAYHLEYWLEEERSRELWTLLDASTEELPQTTVEDGFKIVSWELEENRERGVWLRFDLHLGDDQPEQTLLSKADQALSDWAIRVQESIAGDA